MTWVGGIVIALCCLPWLVTFAANVKMQRSIRSLAEVHPSDPAVWPRLSIVIAACNEAETLEPALKTLVDQDYPDLEVVVVDDRSSDGTTELVDRLAAAHPRLRALHVTELPSGWLGKVHALHVATEATTGEVILFTDADVAFEPGVLRHTVAELEQRQLDHLCIVPDLDSRSFWVRLGIAAAVRTIALSQRPWEAEDPDAPGAIGSGAFNMVRRKSFLASEGFAWLRMEVADDVGLGHLMKRSGGRAGLLMARGQVRVEWYADVRAMFRGMEKNGFAQVAQFSLLRGLGFVLLAAIVALAPFAALAWPIDAVRAVGAAALAAHLGSVIILARWTSIRAVDALLSAPLGDLLMAAVVTRATVLGVRRGGLIWRGTVYPVDALREGVRVRF